MAKLIRVKDRQNRLHLKQKARKRVKLTTLLSVIQTLILLILLLKHI